MSRITAPVSKLTRTIGSNAAVARPSNILQTGSKAAAASHLAELSENHESTRHISTLPSHRPQPVPSRTRTVPLMQTFTTSSSPRARADSSSIDFAVMPTHASLYAAPSSSSTPPRMPLLPDSFSITHSQPEQADAPLPAAEISIVAANPENVSAVSPLTEVEGMGADGVELGFVHGLREAGQRKTEETGGMIRDLWKGLMDDVFGEEKKPKTA